MTNKLALLGGSAVRVKPWLVEPMTDTAEEALVLAAVRGKNFSRYIGSTAPNIEQLLRLPSAAAADITDYWHFLGGTNVRQFSGQFAERMRVRYAIPVNSATTGLSVALAAVGVGPGDEVIMPAISYTATGSAPLLFGGVPVFVDVDPQSFCIDPAKITEAITSRTKALLPVHLVGNVANLDAILEIARAHGLAVVEDAAQAIGATWHDRFVGTIGHAGVFSFQQSKNIMTGEGGMIVTDDPDIARRCRLICNHGEVVFEDDARPSDLAGIVGCNFRMPELCAALGLAQLAKLDQVNAWRTRNADILFDGLSGIRGLDIPRPQRHDANNPASDVPHLFVALHDEKKMGIPRSIFVAALRAEGVPVGTGYMRPMYANPTFLTKMSWGSEGFPWSKYPGSGQDYRHGLAPVAEKLLEDRFLWFYHIAYASTAEDMSDIVHAVRKVVDQSDDLRAIDQQSLGSLAARSQGRAETSQRANAATGSSR